MARAIEAQFLESTTVTRAFLPTLVFFLEVSILTMAGGASFGQRLTGTASSGALDGVRRRASCGSWCGRSCSAWWCRR